jgi:DNA-binding NarL/FixJ family response regulator
VISRPEVEKEMQESKINVVIADDMLPIREYLQTVLGHEPDMEIIAAVGSGKEAVATALNAYERNQAAPHVVLMDLEMETPRAGVEAIEALSQKAPGVRCVVLTHFADDETVFNAFEAGAVDYLLKDASVAEILEAVRSAARGMSPIRPRIAELIRKEFQAMRAERAALVSTLNIVYRLTPTELELLRLLAEGKTQKEITEIRHIAPSTMRTHMANILKKFAEPTAKDVVKRLKRLGIFDIFWSGQE